MGTAGEKYLNNAIAFVHVTIVYVYLAIDQ